MGVGGVEREEKKKEREKKKRESFVECFFLRIRELFLLRALVSSFYPC